MGFLNAEKPRRVELGDGFWADVRTLSAEEYAKVEEHLVSARVSKQGAVAMDTNLSEFRRALVTASVTDWNLTDEADVQLPVNRESVGRLPIWAFEEIRKAADELNGPRRGQDAAQFRDAGAGGDQDGDGGSGDAAEVPAGAGVVASAGAASDGPGEAT